MELRKNLSLRKQAIRIVSVILDAFHFDISQAEENTKSEQKPDTTEEPKEDEEEPMEIDDADQNEDKESKKSIPVVERITMLGRSDATRVYRSIKSFLIPSLDRAFMTYDDSEQYHKLSKKDSNSEKEEIAVMSIPIAYAAVKLMKRLPRSILDQYIST